MDAMSALRKMLEHTDIVIFAAARSDGYHTAVIHMREMTKEKAMEIAKLATMRPCKVTHFEYSNEQGGIEKTAEGIE